MASMTVAPLPGLATGLRPLPGESLCGDQLGYFQSQQRLRLAVADGLGHGAEAHQAAAAVMQVIGASPDMDLTALFAHCDQALLGTRGVALAIIDVEARASRIVHASVGNVRALLMPRGRVKRLSGARGIVGAGYRNLRPESFPLHPGDWLLLFSDGIPENADFASVLSASESNHEPSTEPSTALVDQLLTRWASPRDDASLIIYRHG